MLLWSMRATLATPDAPVEIAVGDLPVEIPTGVEIAVGDLSHEGAIMVSPRASHQTCEIISL